jgi:hypothetical protein
VSETKPKMNCEKCKLWTAHERIRESIPLVVWPRMVHRIDYGTSKYRCTRCGEVRVYIEESMEDKYPPE